MEDNFAQVLKDTYEKTMKLAVDITQNKAALMNAPLTGNDIKFVRKIAKGYKDFQDQSGRNKRKLKTTEDEQEPLTLSPLKFNKTAFLPRNSGKQKLNASLEERNRYVSGSKAGKPVRYAEIGPVILEKIKTNSSIYSEDHSKAQLQDKPPSLSHISITTGKLKSALELPSFKEYALSEKLKDPKQMAFERIDNCSKQLDGNDIQQNVVQSQFRAHLPSAGGDDRIRKSITHSQSVARC